MDYVNQIYCNLTILGSVDLIMMKQHQKWIAHALKPLNKVITCPAVIGDDCGMP